MSLLAGSTNQIKSLYELQVTKNYLLYLYTKHRSTFYKERLNEVLQEIVELKKEMELVAQKLLT